MRSSRAPLVVLATASAFVLGACSQGENGTPEAEGGPTSAVSQPAADESPLSGFDPCSALTTEEVAKHGAVKGGPTRETIGTAQVCSWDGDPGHSTKDVPSTAVAVRENGGVDQMTDFGRGVQRSSENGREYAQSAGNGGCTIAISVTKSSRVDIQVSGIDDLKACDMANALVEVAEPRIPQG
ncbi:DUF3558 family protein [Prauserella rugosa]|nr:DUF3558 family protein [Prauserella rugosa]